MKKSKNLLTVLLVGVATIVAIPFLKELWEERKEDNKQVKIEKQIDEVIKNDKEQSSRVKKLIKKNKDVIGFIEIPGTTISYPVMQTKDNPDFYLNHDINKDYSSYGTPYLSAYCDLKTSDQLIVYGHNMGYNKMFGVLTNYRDESYLKAHPSIILETKNKKSEYEIFAVMSVNKYDFPYWSFVMAKDEAEYDEYVEKVIHYTLQNCTHKPNYGDQILALSTCDNRRGHDYRFVVMAKMSNC